jgi:hypothetical protein
MNRNKKIRRLKMTGSLPSMKAVEAALSKKLPQNINICAEGVNGFRDALHRTFRGDTIIYHVGDYAGGRFKKEALQAQADGFVALVQRKLGPNLFQYEAQRTNRKPKK